MLVLLASSAVYAQRVPDAGLLLREQLKTTPTLPEHNVPNIRRDVTAAPNASSSDSAQFVLASIHISGNSVFSESELLAQVQDIIGQSVGLADLNAAAVRISRYYRSHGYMVARAYLPPQDIVDGGVQIAVVEGRFGEFKLYNTSHVLDRVVRDHLQGLSGDIIAAPDLERALLLLDDLPGIGDVHAALKPGANNGEADAVLDLEKEPVVSGSLEGDNFGNRYVGANQLTAKLNLDSPLWVGDALAMQFTHSDDDMEFKRLSYQLPIGNDGLKLGTSYVASKYRLGSQFTVLDASGDSTSYTLSTSFPFVRSSGFSLYGQVIQAWREFEDRTDAVSLVDNRSSNTTTLLLNGNSFDNYWGGGGSTFALAYTSGNLNIETPAVRSIDDVTARTDGGFSKWNLQLLRVQRLSERTSAYLSFTGQKAGSNLDSSEKFIVGGVNGVRAYPQGEAPGDSGYVASAELRYQLETESTLGTLQPFVLVETGGVTINEDPFVTGANFRRLSGCGVGLAWFGVEDLVVKLTLARRLGNEPVLSDQDELTRVWAQAAWSF
jgi:hemolysin activation/secretion protein